MQMSKAKWSMDESGTWLSILGDHAEVVNLCKSINPDKKYKIEIKEEKKRRSLDANAYAWVLLGKLSAKLQGSSRQKITAEDVYRQYIPDIGDNFEMMLVADQSQKKICDIWSSKGIGWVTDILSPSKEHEGYSWIRFYYGSSLFNSEQMSRLIDFIIADCKENDIETLSPDKIQIMKEGWQ